jgi:GT2 family glycosyltransferase
MNGSSDNGELARPEGELDLSIIIVSYNTRDMTLHCLQSIYDETRDISREIIVVDNNSSDDSATAIAQLFPAVELIALTENIGFARANNLAAANAHGRRILLLNPDTVILDRAVDRLVQFANATPSCRVWGGRTVFADGSLNRSSCFRRMTLWSLFCFASGLTYFGRRTAILNSEGYGGWDRDTERQVDIVTGCFLLIDRLLWESLRGFDPTFFMYGEEADLCERARLLGARPAITPRATIVHYGGASDVVAVDKRVKVFKGRITLINRHFPWGAREIGRALHLIAPLTRWCGYRLAAGVARIPEFTEQAEYWHAVWSRRGEWVDGYETCGAEAAKASLRSNELRKDERMVLGHDTTASISPGEIRPAHHPSSLKLTEIRTTRDPIQENIGASSQAAGKEQKTRCSKPRFGDLGVHREQY